MGKKPQVQQAGVSSSSSLLNEVSAVSSGWLLLDSVVSWWGGFPEGSINIVSGGPNSGKTSICLNAAVDAMTRLGWKVLYFDVESRLMANPQRLLGRVPADVVREKFVYFPAENMVEKVASIIRGEITTSENYPKLIIIDSLSSMQSLKQFNIMQVGKWEDQSNQLVAALARGIVETFKDLFSYYTPAKKLVFVLTAQVRANIQHGGYRPTKPALGYYVLHAAHTHISLFSYDTKKSEVDEMLLGLPLEVKLPGMSEPRPTFRTVVASLEKGQLGPAGSNVTIRGLMYQVSIPELEIYMGGFHNIYDLVKYGRNPTTQFLKRLGGGRYMAPSGLEFSPQELVSDVALRKKALEECSPVFHQKLQQAMLSLRSKVKESSVESDEQIDNSEET